MISSPENIGWSVNDINSLQVIKEKDDFLIGQTPNGKKVLILKSLIKLSIEEKEFIERALQYYREKCNPKKKDSSYALKKQLLKENLKIDEEQKIYLDTVMFLETNGQGPLTKFLDLEELEEIAVTGTGKNNPIRVYHSSFGWLESNVYFKSNEKIIEIANRIALRQNRRLSLTNPRLNCELENGSRMNALMPPLSKKGASITIRMFSKNRPNPTVLCKNNTLSFECAAFLWLALESDSSLLICGNTGSGKTTVLNSILSFIPINERIVSIEETPELVIPLKHNVKLISDESKNATIENLILDTLRMRPDRIIVGEIRSKKETKAFANTLIAGQGKGSLATFHGQSAKDAISRLIQQGFNEQDLNALDLLLIQKRWTEYNKRAKVFIEKRKLKSVYEIYLKNGKAKLRKLFSYNKTKNKMIKNNESKYAIQKILESHSLKKSKYKTELNKRKQILKKASKKKFNSLSKYSEYIFKEI